jgi:hypothetical protein
MNLKSSNKCFHGWRKKIKFRGEYAAVTRDIALKVGRKSFTFIAT